MKPKRKTKRDLFHVDFVTAYTVEECRDRLTHADYAQSVRVSDTGAFTIEQDLEWRFPPHYKNGFKVEFRGQLDPTGYGTRVHGAITPQTLTRLNVSKWLMWIFTGIPLLFAVVVVEEPLDSMCFVWLAFVLIVGVLFAYWYTAYTNTAAMTDWIHDLLYVLPDEDV